MNSSKIRRSRAEAVWRFRMELRADGEPIGHAAFDRFDDAVRAAGGHFEAGGDVVDRHVVHAVDAELAVAVDALHQRAGRELQRVAMGRVERIVMRQARSGDLPECGTAGCRPSSR